MSNQEEPLGTAGSHYSDAAAKGFGAGRQNCCLFHALSTEHLHFAAAVLRLTPSLHGLIFFSLFVGGEGQTENQGIALRGAKLPL